MALSLSPRPVFEEKKTIGNLNISLNDSPSLKVCPKTEKAIFLKLCPVLPLQKFSCIPTSDDLQGAQHSNFWWSVHLDMSNCLLQSIEYPYSMSNLHQVTNCLNWFEYRHVNFLWQHCFDAKIWVFEETWLDKSDWVLKTDLDVLFAGPSSSFGVPYRLTSSLINFYIKLFSKSKFPSSWSRRRRL